MKTKLFVAMAVFGVAAFAAGCDDTSGTGGAGGAGSSTTGSSSSKATTGSSMTTTGTNTGSSSSGGATCPVTGMTDTCANACATLYDCGALAMCNGKDLCAGIDGTAMQKMQFIGTDTGTCAGTPAMMCKLDADCPMVGGQKDTCSGGCLVTCNNNAALKALLDPMDCEGTITTVSTVSPSFGAFCKGM